MAWVDVVFEDQQERVLFTDNPKVHQEVADGLPYESQGGGFCNHMFVMRSGFLKLLAIELEDQYQAGHANSVAKIAAGKSRGGRMTVSGDVPYDFIVPKKLNMQLLARLQGAHARSGEPGKVS